METQRPQRMHTKGEKQEKRGVPEDMERKYYVFF